MSGYLGVPCTACGNDKDPLGVMYDHTGALVCFWCASIKVATEERGA